MTSASNVELEITFDDGETSSTFIPDTELDIYSDFSDGDLLTIGKKAEKHYLKKLVEFLIVLFLSACMLWVFTMPYCDFIFKCGCTWRWKGGASECNAFSETDPDSCPLCSAPRFFMGFSHLITIVATVLTYYGFCYLFKRYEKKQQLSSEEESLVSLEDTFEIYSFTESATSKWDRQTIIQSTVKWILRVSVFVLTFFVVGFILSFLFYLPSDYPTFIVHIS